MLLDQPLYKSRVGRRIDIHFCLGGLVGGLDVATRKERCLFEPRRVFVVTSLAVVAGNKGFVAHQQWVNRVSETVGTAIGGARRERPGGSWISDGRGGQVDLTGRETASGRVFPVVDPAGDQRATKGGRGLRFPAKVAVELGDKLRGERVNGRYVRQCRVFSHCRVVSHVNIKGVEKIRRHWRRSLSIVASPASIIADYVFPKVILKITDVDVACRGAGIDESRSGYARVRVGSGTDAAGIAGRQ